MASYYFFSVYIFLATYTSTVLQKTPPTIGDFSSKGILYDKILLFPSHLHVHKVSLYVIIFLYQFRIMLHNFTKCKSGNELENY